MFSVSTRTKYGLAATLDLAEHYGQGLVQSKDVAGRQDIPRSYLEQIFNRLAKHGIVKGTRGKLGGYELTEEPGSTSVLGIFEALEGELKLSEGVEAPALAEVFLGAEKGVREALGLSLGQLLQRQRELGQQPMFHI